MKLGQFLGVESTGEIQITKPVSTICVSFSDDFKQLHDETISVMIQRDNGNAVVLNRVSLKSLMLLQTYDAQIVSFGEFKTNCAIPLTPNGGAIALNQNERIIVTFESLQNDKTYLFHAEEEPFTTKYVYDYDKKACLVGEEQRLLDFVGYDQILLQGSNAIVDARFVYDNNASCLHTLYELKLNSYVNDPFSALSSDGVITEIEDTLVIPLTGVRQIDFSKDKTKLVEVLCRKTRTLSFTNTGIFSPRPNRNFR